MPGSPENHFQSVSRAPSGRRPLVVTGLAGLAILGLVLAVRTIGNAPEVGQGDELLTDLPPAAVFVQPVAQELSQNTVKVTGTLRALARAEVAAREAGAVLEVFVDEGQPVEREAVLVKLDDRRAGAQLREAEATLTAAQNLVEQRQAELQRAQDDLTMKQGLLERQAVSKSDILDAKRGLAVAQAQHDAAHEGVEELSNRVAFLKVQLEDTVIRAPFSGVVVQRQVELGEWVAAGTVIATLVKIHPIEAWLRVPARHGNGVSQSPKHLRVVQASSGLEFTPQKVITVPDVDPMSQLFTVVATLDNENDQFTPGESVTGIVPIGERSAHWQFPIDALLRTATGDYVYLADEKAAIAKRVPVSVAFENQGKAYVAQANAAFQEGDRVVIEGNERLQPGQGLIIRERQLSATPGQP